MDTPSALVHTTFGHGGELSGRSRGNAMTDIGSRGSLHVMATLLSCCGMQTLGRWLDVETRAASLNGPWRTLTAPTRCHHPRRLVGRSGCGQKTVSILGQKPRGAPLWSRLWSPDLIRPPRCLGATRKSSGPHRVPFWWLERARLGLLWEERMSDLTIPARVFGARHRRRSRHRPSPGARVVGADVSGRDRTRSARGEWMTIETLAAPDREGVWAAGCKGWRWLPGILVRSISHP